jgi:MraZ protein
VDTSPQPPPLRPPSGIFSSRCDDKGRVRLPKEFEEYLKTLPDPDFFVTSIDQGSVVRVYPMAVWDENKKVFEHFEEDPEGAEDFAYMADYFGGVSQIDGQGRVLVPPVLRRQAGIEDRKVFVRFYNSAVEIYSEAESEKRLKRASEAYPANVKALRRKGLK